MLRAKCCERWELTVANPAAVVAAAINRRAGADQPARPLARALSPNHRLRALIATLTAQVRDTGNRVCDVVMAARRMVD